MESYQYVKREGKFLLPLFHPGQASEETTESIRRMFHRWLASARVSRHRRVTLQQKEDEMNFGVIAAAWDKWRDRFSDETLRPLVSLLSVVIGLSEHLSRNMASLFKGRKICCSEPLGYGTPRPRWGLPGIFNAFSYDICHEQSLPAIRFHSSHAKLKYWQIWRGVMPQALRAKLARKMDRKRVLGEHPQFCILRDAFWVNTTSIVKFLDKWVQKQRTKVALKAVSWVQC
jgi:protein SFI1